MADRSRPIIEADDRTRTPADTVMHPDSESADPDVCPETDDSGYSLAATEPFDVSFLSSAD